MTSTQQRAALQRQIWQIANDVRTRPKSSLTEQATTSQTLIQPLQGKWRAFSHNSSKVFCIFLTTQKIFLQPNALELPQICEVRCA